MAIRKRILQCLNCPKILSKWKRKFCCDKCCLEWYRKRKIKDNG